MEAGTPRSMASSTPMKRACDSCHRRKVKCIGEPSKPCKNCISAGLTCTYNAIPQKKGPKGSRAKVLSELRENQRQSNLAAVYPSGMGYDAHDIASAHRTPGLLNPAMVDACVEFWFTNFYPTQPILHRQHVQNTRVGIDHSDEAYCFTLALCAYVLIQSNMPLPPGVGIQADYTQMSSFNMGQLLLNECVRIRKNINYIEAPTFLSVVTSFFLFGCHFALDKQNTAWFNLREATTLALTLGMQDEGTYKTGDVIECSRRRRLFWLLFVTERAYALHKHRPLSLHATIHLPTVDEDPTETAHIVGFIHMVNLYKPFDDTFIGLWNKVRTECMPSWLAQLQAQLSKALPAYLEGTEVQAVDLRTSQQWLRTMVWQLAISHGFVSSMATDAAMSFKYPLEISREMATLSSQFSQQAMEVHGVGLIEKLFDVACTLTDVMTCVPFEQSAFELGPRDYLSRFLTLISTLRGGQSRFLPLLISKINQNIPHMSIPMPRSLPSGPPSNPGQRVDEIYESSASTSHEATPFESPRPGPIGMEGAMEGMPMRHGSSHSMYSTTSPLPQQTYPSPFAQQQMSIYPEVPSVSAVVVQGIYQPHHPGSSSQHGGYE